MAKQLRIATSRINYKGQQGQVVLNTTVGSGKGLGQAFAPTWGMVWDSKQGRIDWDEYTRQYTDLLRKRYKAHPTAFQRAIDTGEVVLCCYCPDTHETTCHCHRYLLADILEKVARAKGYEVTRLGEVANPKEAAKP